MSRNRKKTKSTTEYKSSGFLIPAIAILETLVLIAVSTYAWYYFSSNKRLSSAVITVNADSGLDIDFRDADKTSYIDVWDYVNEDFAFEPASSTDGRQIYFPTSGTFGATETESMIFREGTANDVNTKYISIDFTLTNTNPAGTDPMDVYLSNNSRFLLKDGENTLNGKALRLAFYNNDGNTGAVNSTFAANHTAAASVSTGSSSSASDPDKFTLYMYKPSDWGSVKAYIFDSFDATSADADGYSNSGTYSPWSGTECSHVSGDIYSITFSNPYKTKTVQEDGKDVVYTHPTRRLYDKVIFTKGYTGYGNQTNTFNITNGKIYDNSQSTGFSGNDISFSTIYFLKPDNWNAPFALLQNPDDSNYFNNGAELAVSNNNASYAEKMTEVATGIYAYTFPSLRCILVYIDGKVYA